jgi:hypothetical protein
MFIVLCNQLVSPAYVLIFIIIEFSVKFDSVCLSFIQIVDFVEI